MLLPTNLLGVTPKTHAEKCGRRARSEIAPRRARKDAPKGAASGRAQRLARKGARKDVP